MQVAPARIHSSAVIDPDAELAGSVTVGPNVVVEADVVVGEETHLLPGSIVHRGSRIGARCRIGPYAVVGGEPMDTSFKGEPSRAVLSDEVTLREFVTVHRATGEVAETRIGAGSLVMSYAHVSHNVQVGNHCVLTTHTQLGGHAEVEDYAVLGAGALLHQFCRVGRFAMFGAGSGANRDILPFSLARGNPARHYRLNRVGLKRRGITDERYATLEHAVRAFRRRDWTRLEELAQHSEDVRYMLEFRAASRRGLSSFF